VLVSWYIQPIFGAGDDNGPLYPTIFDLRGVALAAWTLAAFAIGGLAGILIRRVIPAMFANLCRVGRARLRDRVVPAPALRGAGRHH
jgi:hypothetical protein